jgi:serum/glucocorticoid-regulated kinase 2
MITAQSNLMLGDFGLSHILKEGEQGVNDEKNNNKWEKGRSYSVSGTSEYLSPEMILNRGHSFSADYWQLGVVLHECLTLRHPFYHRNVFRMQQNILCRNPLFDENTLSKEAIQLLQGLLVKDPAKRLGNNELNDFINLPFFTKYNIQFDAVERCEIRPEYKVHLENLADTSNFDQNFTSEQLLLDDLDLYNQQPQISQTTSNNDNTQSNTSNPYNDSASSFSISVTSPN